MTSLPLTEPSACHVPICVPGATMKTDWSLVTPRGSPVAELNAQELMVSLMNRTEPSTKATFTPPGWKLEALLTKATSRHVTALSALKTLEETLHDERLDVRSNQREQAQGAGWHKTHSVSPLGGPINRFHTGNSILVGSSDHGGIRDESRKIRRESTTPWG